jgi:hypothetical protein
VDLHTKLFRKLSHQLPQKLVATKQKLEQQLG